MCTFYPYLYNFYPYGSGLDTERNIVNIPCGYTFQVCHNCYICVWIGAASRLLVNYKLRNIRNATLYLHGIRFCSQRLHSHHATFGKAARANCFSSNVGSYVMWPLRFAVLLPPKSQEASQTAHAAGEGYLSMKSYFWHPWFLCSVSRQ